MTFVFLKLGQVDEELQEVLKLQRGIIDAAAGKAEGNTYQNQMTEKFHSKVQWTTEITAAASDA